MPMVTIVQNPEGTFTFTNNEGFDISLDFQTVDEDGNLTSQQVVEIDDSESASVSLVDGTYVVEETNTNSSTVVTNFKLFVYTTIETCLLNSIKNVLNSGDCEEKDCVDEGKNLLTLYTNNRLITLAYTYFAYVNKHVYDNWSFTTITLDELKDLYLLETVREKLSKCCN